MANFIGLVYATLKENGIDTSKMSTDEAVAKFKELQGEGKEEKKDTPEDVKKKLGEKKEEPKQEEPSEIKDKLNGKETAKVSKEQIVDKLTDAGFRKDAENTYKISKDGKDVTISFTDNGKAFRTTTLSGTVYTYKDIDTAIDRATFKSGKKPSDGAVGWETGSYNREAEEEYLRKNI